MASSDADILLISASTAGSLTLSNDMEKSAIPPAIETRYGNARNKKFRILFFIVKNDNIARTKWPWGKIPHMHLEIRVFLYYNKICVG